MLFEDLSEKEVQTFTDQALALDPDRKEAGYFALQLSFTVEELKLLWELAWGPGAAKDWYENEIQKGQANTFSCTFLQVMELRSTIVNAITEAVIAQRDRHFKEIEKTNDSIQIQKALEEYA